MTHWARPAAPVLPTGRSKQASCRAASSGTDHASASALSYRGTYENGLSAVRVRGVVRCSVYVLTLFRVRQVDAFSFQAECCDRSVRIGAQNALGGTDETNCAGRKPRCFCIVWCKRPDRRSTGQGCDRYIERSQLRDGLQSAAVQPADADQQGHRQEPRSGVELQLRRRPKRGIAAAGLPGRALRHDPQRHDGGRRQDRQADLEDQGRVSRRDAAHRLLRHHQPRRRAVSTARSSAPRSTPMSSRSTPRPARSCGVRRPPTSRKAIR